MNKSANYLAGTAERRADQTERKRKERARKKQQAKDELMSKVNNVAQHGNIRGIAAEIAESKNLSNQEKTDLMSRLSAAGMMVDMSRDEALTSETVVESNLQVQENSIESNLQVQENNIKANLQVQENSVKANLQVQENLIASNRKKYEAFISAFNGPGNVGVPPQVLFASPVAASAPTVTPVTANLKPPPPPQASLKAPPPPPSVTIPATPIPSSSTFGTPNASSSSFLFGATSKPFSVSSNPINNDGGFSMGTTTTPAPKNLTNNDGGFSMGTTTPAPKTKTRPTGPERVATYKDSRTPSGKRHQVSASKSRASSQAKRNKNRGLLTTTPSWAVTGDPKDNPFLTGKWKDPNAMADDDVSI